MSRSTDRSQQTDAPAPAETKSERDGLASILESIAKEPVSDELEELARVLTDAVAEKSTRRLSH